MRRSLPRFSNRSRRRKSKGRCRCVRRVRNLRKHMPRFSNFPVVARKIQSPLLLRQRGFFVRYFLFAILKLRYSFDCEESFSKSLRYSEDFFDLRRLIIAMIPFTIDTGIITKAISPAKLNTAL